MWMVFPFFWLHYIVIILIFYLSFFFLLQILLMGCFFFCFIHHFPFTSFSICLSIFKPTLLVSSLLSLSLSLSLSIYLSIYQSIYRSIYLSLFSHTFSSNKLSLLTWYNTSNLMNWQSLVPSPSPNTFCFGLWRLLSDHVSFIIHMCLCKQRRRTTTTTTTTTPTTSMKDKRK